MIQRRLSKEQGYVISALAQQQAGLQQQLADVRAAIAEQGAVLQGHFNLPDGEVAFRMNGDAWEMIVKPMPQSEPMHEVEAESGRTGD